MKSGREIVCVALLLLFGVAAATLAETAHQDSTPATLDGPTLFRERGCAQCHAIGGVGGRKGPELSRVGRTRSPAELEQQILEGSGAMPPYREALTPEETNRLVKYLHTLR